MIKRFFSFISIGLLFSMPVLAQTITTIAGNGAAGYAGDGAAANSCELNHPYGIAVDAAGNIYIADRSNNCIRKVNASGIITTIAGNGTAAFSGDNNQATAAALNGPTGIAIDGTGNVYIGDAGNGRVRKINSAGIITTIAGTGATGYGGDGGPATDASLSGPRGVAIDGSGNIYIADPGNNRIRYINTLGIIRTFAGTGTGGFGGDGGPATAAELKTPYGVATDIAGNVYISDIDNERIRKVNSLGTISTIAGNGTAGYGGDFGPATAAALNEPIGIAVDNNNNVYIADGWNGRIRVINNSGTITTVAGNGTSGYSGDGGVAYMAGLNDPYGIAVADPGDIYIADYTNNRIRFVTHTTGIRNIPGSSAAMTIYPNPGNGIFTLNISSAQEEQVQITVSNVVGEKVWEISAKTGTPIPIYLDAPDGVYVLTAKTSATISSSKVVVCH